jgi:hypothetical protein
MEKCIESSQVVKGRAGPEFQVRVPGELRGSQGVTAFRLKLSVMHKRALHASLFKRGGVAKAMFGQTHSMESGKPDRGMSSKELCSFHGCEHLLWHAHLGLISGGSFDRCDFLTECTTFARR